MSTTSDSKYQVTLYTAKREPLLAGALQGLGELGLERLSRRFPGLKIPRHAFYPDRVELLLDFGRLDEDLPRVVQFFKFEVKNEAKKRGFQGDSLWQWNYDVLEVPLSDRSVDL